jgi:hypothetical protein
LPRGARGVRRGQLRSSGDKFSVMFEITAGTHLLTRVQR